MAEGVNGVIIFTAWDVINLWKMNINIEKRVYRQIRSDIAREGYEKIVKIFRDEGEKLAT